MDIKKSALQQQKKTLYMSHAHIFCVIVSRQREPWKFFLAWKLCCCLALLPLELFSVSSRLPSALSRFVAPAIRNYLLNGKILLWNIPRSSARLITFHMKMVQSSLEISSLWLWKCLSLVVWGSEISPAFFLLSSTFFFLEPRKWWQCWTEKRIFPIYFIVVVSSVAVWQNLDDVCRRSIFGRAWGDVEVKLDREDEQHTTWKIVELGEKRRRDGIERVWCCEHTKEMKMHVNF